jgi:hypothetical protein
MKIIKIFAFIIIGIVLFLLTIGVITAMFSTTSDSDDNPVEQKKNEITNVEEKPVEPEEPTYLWEYSQSTDEMDNKTRYFASILSDNKLYFEFPYGGGSAGILTIRNMDGKNSVVLRIEKGQFMSNYDDSEYIRVKFDEDDLEKYGFNTAADGSSDIIFPYQSAKLISKIKKAKKIKIEAHFYNEGRQVLNFTTEGLQWDK